jgi:hypothetical protein
MALYRNTDKQLRQDRLDKINLKQIKFTLDHSLRMWDSWGANRQTPP